MSSESLAIAIKAGKKYHIFDARGNYIRSYFYPRSAESYRNCVATEKVVVKYLTNTAKQGEHHA